MIIYDEDEALERLGSPQNLVNRIHNPVVVKELHSNRNGSKGIPPMVQELIGVAATLTTQREAADSFGVSQPMARLYEHGMTKGSKGVAPKVQESHDAAIDAMLSAIKAIPDRIPNVKKATDLSTIAANMARVVEKTTPKELEGKSNVQVIFFSPRIKDESEYETVND